MTQRRTAARRVVASPSGDFFRRDICANFCNMVNIFTCRCPNRSGVGAIDSPDRFEQVLDQRYIPEVSEKIFTHDISMVRRQKMSIFDVLKTFISKITYYKLFKRKLEVIARKKYALRFSP